MISITNGGNGAVRNVCPVRWFVIVPARGVLSLSITTRRSTDPGKLMVPLLAQRNDVLDRMVREMLADFRWDCSMVEAGADWITADVLCAAYANIRWNYRKRPAQTQQKAGFDKKQKDRNNWRRHYSLFVSSARDAGRLLYNKWVDVYEVAVKYIGLPPDIERLRRD